MIPLKRILYGREAKKDHDDEKDKNFVFYLDSAVDTRHVQNAKICVMETLEDIVKLVR